MTGDLDAAHFMANSSLDYYNICFSCIRSLAICGGHVLLFCQLQSIAAAGV